VTTAGLDQAVQKLRAVRNLDSLTAYLRDELDWPMPTWDIEDLTFEYTAEEAGLDPKTAVKVNSIRRLRPISPDQPWGIFFIDFVPGDLPITVLRRILRTVVVKKRAAGSADGQTWRLGDLLFISVMGEDEHRDLNLSHFSEDALTGRATLRVVEWDEADTHFHMLRTRRELKQLAWRGADESLDAWRERWSGAFALKRGEVADTSKKLASQMARLAKLIRRKVNEAIAVESEKGPLRRLHTAFREVLIHDLDADGFADMYAQTLTYGLFAARCSRPEWLIAENARDMVPASNPFLRDLLAQFTDISGLTASLDFDELGIDALVQMLREANIAAVVEDFGRSKPGEDPVIHFYEDFLLEYNRKQKVQRGIFYTPRPVVSFIVRSVHELLQSEFGLEDGLASTATWGDMAAKFPELKLPEGTAAETPFVQVLDPAVGTGTFLVEIIDVIYRVMTEKWRKEGRRPFEVLGLWNDYVPTHLLPRLYGFELMMAPYAICHMKLALKLTETGYNFLASERLRVYLTNTLEPPQDFSGQFDIMAPALAHEARAVKQVKRHTPFTVIVGNPPYSKISANLSPNAVSLIDPFRFVDGQRIAERGALALEMALQDDYVKFFGFMLRNLGRTQIGVGSFISNFRFLDSGYLRGMRAGLLKLSSRVSLLNLGGHLANQHPGVADENVFDIEQGVAILIATIGGPPAKVAVSYERLFGLRADKYEALLGQTTPVTIGVNPTSPQYRLMPFDRMDEYYNWLSLESIFPVNSGAIITSRDGLAINFDREELLQNVQRFAMSGPGDTSVMRSLGFSAKPSWNIESCKRSIRSQADRSEPIKRVLYRPFDLRFIYYHPPLLDTPSRPVSASLFALGGPALLTPKVKTTREFSHVFVSRVPAEKKAASHDRATQMFPLEILEAPGGIAGGTRRWNLSEEFIGRLASALGHAGGNCTTAFHFIYGVLHSHSYRARYESALQEAFPRIPITTDAELYLQIASFGADLVALHLLEDTYPGASWVGASPPNSLGAGLTRLNEKSALEVEPKFPKLIDGRVWISRHAWLIEGIPEEVWKFDIGGYQPAQKWLKDRRGRTLTTENIEHYKRIVTAISETIRIMGEIDEVIEAHGGWPLAGSVPAEA